MNNAYAKSITTKVTKVDSSPWDKMEHEQDIQVIWMQQQRHTLFKSFNSLQENSNRNTPFLQVMDLEGWPAVTVHVNPNGQLT